MKKFLDNLYKNQSLIYKGFLIILTTALVVYLFPKGGKFKYDFHKGKLWQYETLYAPFDFAIHKTDNEIEQNKDEIKSNHTDYFKYDVATRDLVYQGYKEKFNTFFTAEDYSNSTRKELYSNGLELLNRIYEKGVVQNSDQYKGDVLVNVVRGNQEQTILYGSLVKISQLDRVISGFLIERNLKAEDELLKSLYFDIIQPNVFYDEALTKMTLERELARVTTTRGSVDKGKRIIAKGE